MKETKQIEHKGIITETADNKVKVSIMQDSVCAKCSVKEICDMSEKEEKIIDIQTFDAKSFKSGDKVNVFYKQTLGFRALFLGYLLPFLIVLVSLIIMMLITGQEGLSGLVALGLLVPYYLILYFKKNKLKKTFAFSVAKIKVP